MTTPAGVPQPPYKKPPIIEAVLAIHFSEAVPVKVIDAFAAKRKAKFPRNEDLIETKFETNLKDSHKNSSRKVGVKLSSADGSRVIMFQSNQFALIHLAPYTDWDCLYDETREHWEALTKILKYRNIAYFSTRYVNRIDIPVSGDNGVDLQKYFHIGVTIPPTTANTLRLENFATTMTLSAPDGAYRFLMQFSTVPSPLIDCASFLVDIDLITSGTHPKRDDDAWAFLKSLRRAKNDLFETCITDETRKLFQ
jgi:uncharacterized protein (TIGR04255 family)